nr:PREDICTED: uncharacterized protein C19orf43 homolog [Bemisia tabaci]
MVNEKDVTSATDAEPSKRSQSSTPPTLTNVFRNDGSFLEMFKKLQETSGSSLKPPAAKIPVPSSDSSCSKSKPSIPFVGKRRGGKVLPCGKVKKVKTSDTEEKDDEPKDAWSQYLKEVKKYREANCDEEDNKTRPLVK